MGSSRSGGFRCPIVIQGGRRGLLTNQLISDHPSAVVCTVVSGTFPNYHHFHVLFSLFGKCLFCMVREKERSSIICSRGCAHNGCTVWSHPGQRDAHKS